MLTRVLLAHNFYRQRGGEDTVFSNERQLLTENGVEVITYERDNEDVPDHGRMNLLLHTLSMSWNKKTHREISALIRKKRPQVAHFHNTFQLISPSAYAACHDNGIPVIQTLHNYRLVCPGALLQRDGKPCESCIGKAPLQGIMHGCYRDSALASAAVSWMLVRNRLNGSYVSGVDRYIALTEFAASRFIAGGLPEDRIVIKSNFLPNPPPAGAGGGRYAVFVGRLSHEKGVRTLLNAWKWLPGIPLKIIGNGPMTTDVETATRERANLIDYLGYLDTENIMQILSHADILVFPSECYEGFPMSILEAYACGTPVVSSDLGSMREIVKEDVTGFKFEAGNDRALADTISAIWNNPAKLKTMRPGIRTHFDENYTAEINFRQLLAIYNAAGDTYTAMTRKTSKV